MTVTFYSYPKCGTCQKAKKWFEANDVAYEMIHIVENPPSKEDVRNLHVKSELPLKNSLIQVECVTANLV